MSPTNIAELPVRRHYQSQTELGDLDLLIGQDVLAFVTDERFFAAWDDLYNACPWATIFQTRDFVASWYKHYSHKHTPILILSRYKGRLTGLLPLADNISELGIAGAGGYDAYYHLWLCAPEHGKTFIEAALQALLKRFPDQDVCLKYIPSNVPMGWLEKKTFWSQHCVVRHFSRPLMNLRNHDREQVLNRRKFKEKYNRLKKLGKVEFELINDAAGFEAIIDQLADQYDFRKAATLNIMPFRDDPAKRQFLLDLFRKGVLMAAVLKVNGNIISGITATTGKDGWSHGAGINTHAPAYSRYSPGYIIIKLLSLALKDAGVTMYDITPGGHAYKDAHADEHDPLLELRVTTIHKSLYLRQFYKIKALLKSAMEKKGVDSRQFRKTVRNKLVLTKEKLILLGKSHAQKAPVLNPAVRPINTLSDKRSHSGMLAIYQDSLKDLLLYDPKGTGETRWEFMKNAIMHCEAGFIPFTYCDDHRLLCLVWQAPQALKSNAIKVINVITSLPKGSVILCDSYCHPASTEKFNQFTNDVAYKISNTSPYETIYLIENVDFVARNSTEV
jgi:hypothetical protein